MEEAGRPAGQPAGFGENIRETFWGAKKRKNTLTGRPAGQPVFYILLVFCDCIRNAFERDLVRECFLFWVLRDYTSC
jgi:hypothetical protein